jgi:hypothetical protein
MERGHLIEGFLESSKTRLQDFTKRMKRRQDNAQGIRTPSNLHEQTTSVESIS